MTEHHVGMRSPGGASLDGPDQVVTGLLRTGARTLLCRRAPGRRWFPGVWDLPGGHLEPGEGDLAALRRELHEELGIEVVDVSAEPVARIRGEDVELRIYAVRTWEGAVGNCRPDEHDEIGWFGPRDLASLELAHPALGSLLAAGGGSLASVNVGVPRDLRGTVGLSGIDKRPVTGPARVEVPAPGRSGMEGDVICDVANHGGPAQALYAFAREDLDWWQERLGRALPDGAFGENLTTLGLDVTGARLGERWAIGDDAVVEVTGPRIPCAAFAVWMNEGGWLKSFTRRARPGAYLRVVMPGELRKGDGIEIVDRPGHEIDVGLCFRALTLERELLPRLLEAGDHLEAELRALALAGRGIDVDDDPESGPG